jgi:hypothetical protein
VLLSGSWGNLDLAPLAQQIARPHPGLLPEEKVTRSPVIGDSAGDLVRLPVRFVGQLLAE